MFANLNVSEPRPPLDPDTPLTFSMEGYHGDPPSALIPRFWAPGWNSVQALNKFQDEVGGPLRGGNPGKRLFEPPAPPRTDGQGAGPKPRYFGEMPAAFKPDRSRRLLLVPMYHIFGSEELSVLSPGVAEQMPRPYLALNPDEAGRLGLGDGEEREITLGGRPRRLVIRLMPALPPGVAGLPAHLPALRGITLPAWSELP